MHLQDSVSLASIITQTSIKMVNNQKEFKPDNIGQAKTSNIPFHILINSNIYSTNCKTIMQWAQCENRTAVNQGGHKLQTRLGGVGFQPPQPSFYSTFLKHCC